MSVIDEIKKLLAGEKKSEFIDQILKEKELHDALHDAGYTVVVDDPQARARQQPFGLLSTLHKIDLIDLITLIEEINTIHLIDRIALIDAITSIVNIARIGRIDNIEAKINPMVNSAFLTDFTGWVNLDPANVTIEDDDTVFIKRVRLSNNCTSLTQFLWADTNKYNKLCFWAFKPAVGGVNIEAEIHFSDGTFITEAKALTNTWHEYTISLTANKIVSQIGFYDLGGMCYFVLPQLVEAPNVFQATRTNLLVKPEREDLLLKDVDFAANAALQSYLAAVGGQKHKVYDYGYEADADGVYYFSATVNGAAWKFGKRITKGVMVQTFVHPVVCDVNTALNFMSTTGNAKTWIHYKTEA